MLSADYRYKIQRIWPSVERILIRGIQILFFLASLFSIALIAYEFGYNVSIKNQRFLIQGYNIVLRIFLYGNILRILLNPRAIWKEKGFWVEIVIFIVLFFVILTQNPHHFPAHTLLQKTDHVLTHILLLFFSGIQLSKDIVATLQRRIKPEMMFTYSFLLIIVAGTFLLKLPNAHRGDLTFIDALFTSVSAVCVTGLTVVDPSTTFTTTGFIILLLLIQIGGIGVMTFTSFIAMSFFSQTSFQDQVALKSILNEESMNNIFRTLFYTLFTTLSIEAAGTYLLWWQIQDIPDNLIPDKLFFSVFHAVSGFCNAGFSTLSGNLYDPIIRHSYGFQSWLAVLIILGGIGFPIVFNYGRLFNHKIRNLLYRLTGSPKRMPSHVRIVSTTTRVVITATIVLLVAGTILFWLFENRHTLSGLSSIEKLAVSFFNSVTPRTAGFNVLSMENLLPRTIFLTLFLMWIGASPMSAGGGIKTTTFVIALKSIYSTIKGKKEVEIARRQLTRGTVNRASTIIFLYILWLSIATLLLSVSESQATFPQILFEVTSALSTVGLTLDFTPYLSTAGKIIICITMFVGRVGSITILSGIFRQQTVSNYTYAEDTVIL